MIFKFIFSFKVKSLWKDYGGAEIFQNVQNFNKDMEKIQTRNKRYIDLHTCVGEYG